MKKKGLIISTVVMVVVLIASLTTATYAWFTTSASVKVDSIALEVKSNANVQVGVRVNPSGTAGYNDYRYGEMTAVAGTHKNDVAWASSENMGLSSTLKFYNTTVGSDGVSTTNPLALGGDKAIGTALGDGNTTPWSVDVTSSGMLAHLQSLIAGGASDNKTIIKAQGKAGTTGNDVELSTIAEAEANVDYMDVTIGMEANKANMKGLYVKVKVTTTGNEPTLGINASIHFLIQIGSTVHDIQPFANAATETTAKASAASLSADGKNNIVVVDNQVESTFYFWVATASGTTTFGQQGSDIHDFRILAYIDGADPHCKLEAKGGCKIDITFDGTENVANLSDSEKASGETTAPLASSVYFINEASATGVEVEGKVTAA